MLDPLHLIASYWVSPTALLVLRFCLLLQASAVVIVDATSGRSIAAFVLMLLAWECLNCQHCDECQPILCCADKTFDSTWLLKFGKWSCIMVGVSGLTGTLVSLKYWTGFAKQSASPRAAVASTMQLKRHQSDIAQHSLPNSWQETSALTSMVCGLRHVAFVSCSSHAAQFARRCVNAFC